ncbi:hypothetical protein CEXT_435041 [Caerostris extrusa]|uniref:Uncharacterized protein n=1 Tax=Caerostris extrusa TaxID=172846 RepID=A0AAV4RPT8_CAEEX|nr:hypothetical protein CEXT_435041 [Caerostris extrusa]
MLNLDIAAPTLPLGTPCFYYWPRMDGFAQVIAQREKKKKKKAVLSLRGCKTERRERRSIFRSMRKGSSPPGIACWFQKPENRLLSRHLLDSWIRRKKKKKKELRRSRLESHQSSPIRGPARENPTVHRPKPLNCTALFTQRENWYHSDASAAAKSKGVGGVRWERPRGASCDGRFISVTGTQCPASVFGRLAEPDPRGRTVNDRCSLGRKKRGLSSSLFPFLRSRKQDQEF